MTLDELRTRLQNRRTRRAIHIHAQRRQPTRPLIYPSDLYPRQTHLPR